MRAAIFHGPGRPLEIDEVEIDRPATREVRVRTVACGVCHSDLHFAQGDWPMLPPGILGHEAAGVVEEVGGGVGELRPGDHVIACPVAFCGACAQCVAGRPHLCLNRGATQRGPKSPPRLRYRGKKIDGLMDIAGFAEQLLVHENAVVKIPPEVPLERAALIGCGVTTGLGAVFNTAQVKPGSSVAVFGCGGIGLAVVQGARLAGALRILAIDVHQSKLELARRMGATDTIDAAAGDPVAEVFARTALGVDYSFECIGLKQAAEQAFGCLQPGGTATIIGMLPLGQKIEIDAPSMLAERKLQGCFMGSTRFPVDTPTYVRYYQQGRLNLDDMVTRLAGLGDIDEAFRAMKAGEVVRTVITFEPPAATA